MILYQRFLLIICIFQQVDAITLVYSMRIRRLFEIGAQVAEQEQKPSWSISAVPILQVRNRRIVDEDFDINAVEDNKIGGSIFNLRYRHSRRWWFEATTGLEKERMAIRGTPNFVVCRSGFDDVVLAGGCNIYPTEHLQYVLYGITGFPTERDFTSREFSNTLIGTRFFSIGAGAEASYHLIHDSTRILTGIIQARFLHFFSRSWFPILPCGSRVEPGNVTDLLFSLQYRKGKETLEMGYNPTFFTNEAAILPNGTKLEADNFVRNYLYINFSHICSKENISENPLIVGIGGNVGWSKEFNTTIFTCWLQFTKSF
jgi:hypothetical protein